MKKLRVAVMGCGRIAAVYKTALQNLSDQCQVVLAMDKDPARARAFAAAFDGCEASALVSSAGFASALSHSGAELVHILLPHHLHGKYAVAAMTAGVDVLTEKPIAITLEEADRMIAAQKTTGRQLGVIFQNRYIDGVQRVRQLILSGQLGEVKGAFSTLNWHRPPSYYECDWKGRWATEGGGVVIDQAIHSIDLVRYMTGMDAVRVQGHTARRVLRSIEVEDEADAAITLENGAVYSFFASNYYTFNSPIRVEIHCANGTALLTQDEMTIHWTDGRVEDIHPAAAASAAPGESYWGAFHEMQLRDCYAALRAGRKIPWSAQDARKNAGDRAGHLPVRPHPKRSHAVISCLCPRRAGCFHPRNAARRPQDLSGPLRTPAERRRSCRASTCPPASKAKSRCDPRPRPPPRRLLSPP